MTGILLHLVVAGFVGFGATFPYYHRREDT